MINTKHIETVLKETKRITEFAEAHDYDDYITVYSSLPKHVMKDVCTLLNHRSGGAWDASPNSGSTIHIKFCV